MTVADVPQEAVKAVRGAILDVALRHRRAPHPDDLTEMAEAAVRAAAPLLAGDADTRTTAALALHFDCDGNCYTCVDEVDNPQSWPCETWAALTGDGPPPPPTAQRLAELSSWVDNAQGDRDPEAVLWGRVSKITEEAGEAIAALIGATGQNPRKGRTHEMSDVRDELLDVAITALAAVEHLTGNSGQSIEHLHAKVAIVYYRMVDQGLLSAAGDPR